MLEHLQKINLVPKDPEGDVLLAALPLAARRRVVKDVVNHLYEEKEATRALSSDFHVRWAMECLGAAFTLPLADAEVIRQAYVVYERWMLSEKDDAPAPFARKPLPFGESGRASGVYACASDTRRTKSAWMRVLPAPPLPSPAVSA